MEVQYNRASKTFVVVDSREEILNVSFPFVDKEGDKDFEIQPLDSFDSLFLYNDNVGENDIRIIKPHDVSMAKENHTERIGWSIPLCSLISNAHKYADKSFFGYYAFAAYRHVLSDSDFIKFWTDNGISSFTLALQQYHKKDLDKMDVVLMIVEQANCQTPISLKDYTMSFALYGYTEIRRVSNKSIPLNGNVIIEKNSDWKVAINKEDIQPYIENLVRGNLYFDNVHIRFFHLYQIIEILIGEKLMIKLRALMNKAEKGFAGSRDFDTCLRNNSEIDRIQDLFNKAQDCTTAKYSYIKSLDDECAIYLRSHGDEENLTFPVSLYHFRNTMVHRFRLLASEEALVTKVNDLFESTLIRLILNIKKDW